MTRNISKLILRLCQVYQLPILLAATFMSELPYSLFTLALLLALLYATLRPLPSGLNVSASAVAMFMVPVAMWQLLSQALSSQPLAHVLATLSALPILYLLDYYLQQHARQTYFFAGGRNPGRGVTSVFTSLFTAAMAMLATSFILSNATLLFTGVLLALYLISLILVALISIPRLPLSTDTLWKRAIAGANLKVAINIANRASTEVHARINPLESWIEVSPRHITLKEKTKLNLSLTPPLAGTSRPQLQASVIDLRGLIQINQLIEPVELRVIPRARYAQWLAAKFLEQTGTGVTATTPVVKPLRMPKRGLEYLDSRTYQPGDRLKDVDWKHTMKLNQLIIKDYIDSGEKAALISVNLSVTGAEEADKLAFDLIATALTLAQENIPTTLAAYNHQKVVLTTSVSDPREIVKQTLSLLKDISFVEMAQRCLEPPKISRLKRNISLLEPAKSEPAQRLLNLLNFECRAMEKEARGHPATIALSLAARHTPTPALIVLVSRFNHDTEALLVTTEKLSRREFTTIRAEFTS